jgi:hypothetical protein
MHFERTIVIEVGHGRRQEELLHTINQYLNWLKIYAANVTHLVKP